MRDYDYATQSDVSLLMGRIDTLEKTIKSLQQNSAPTHPIYDSTNFPQDAVPGQHVQDQNSDMWVYGQDDTWHKIGANIDLPWGYARYSGNFGSSTGLTQIDFNPASGGFVGITSGDSDITFGDNGTGRYSLIMNTVGTYLVSTNVVATVLFSAPDADSAVYLNSQWLPSRSMVGSNVGNFVRVPGLSPATWQANAGELDFLDIDNHNNNAPKSGDTAIAQNSGQTASVIIIQFAVKISSKYYIGQV